MAKEMRGGKAGEGKVEKEREREREVVEEIRGGEGINIPPSRTGVARK